MDPKLLLLEVVTFMCVQDKASTNIKVCAVYTSYIMIIDCIMHTAMPSF